MLEINHSLILEKVTSGKMCSKPTARKMPPLKVLITESIFGLFWHFLLERVKDKKVPEERKDARKET